MMKFARPLFAVLVMGLVAAALILATVSWVESYPGKVHSALETAKSPAVELAETCSAARDSTFTRP